MSNTVENEIVKAANATSTATLVASQAGRLRGVYFRPGAAAGSVVFRDDGASGTIILTLNTPDNTGASVYSKLPGGGISFGTDLHVTLTNSAGVTVFYAEDRTL